MKNYNPLLFSVIVLLFFSSCSFPHYQYSYESAKGLDFRNGKWLVNQIEGDLSNTSKESLTRKLLKKLKNLAVDSVFYINDAPAHYLIPAHLGFELSPETLDDLKNTTDFAYVLTVRGDKLRDDLSPIIIYPDYSDNRNEAEVYIDVYEMASGQRIYSQRIFATVSMNENNEKVQFSKSASRLIYGALNKGMKKIKKYSITR